MKERNDYYYLHKNGTLHYKPSYEERDFTESDLVRRYWKVDPKDRGAGWKIVTEALADGADRKECDRLIDKWGLTEIASIQYAANCDVSALSKQGLAIMFPERYGDR